MPRDGWAYGYFPINFASIIALEDAGGLVMNSKPDCCRSHLVFVCLRRLKSNDPFMKMFQLPGSYFRLSRSAGILRTVVRLPALAMGVT